MRVAQLAGRLGAAQQEDGEQRPLVGLEGEPLVERWWYFRVRGPRSAHTTRTRPRSLRLRSVSVSSGWS